MPSQKRRITGTVTSARVAAGSKSDRVAVVLRADSGAEYILRRRGGNAFRDDVLEGLVGTTITGTGLLADQTFIMDSWTVKARS